MEKINIAEILRDCPKGMELNCTMFDNVTFVSVDYRRKQFPIEIVVGGLRTKYLTKEGCYHDNTLLPESKCVIFPKGKTTWEGFKRPFKDGDVVVAEDDELFQLFLLKHLTYSEDNSYDGYCYFGWDFQCNGLFEKGNWAFNRLATEEEKQKLFDTLKTNGYEWNTETKTLEKLVESKEDTDDRVVMSGIYFDRENYADEVELHLGNYEIEIRNGNTYAIFKNKKTETLKTKFKVGDIIANGKTTIKIGYIDDEYYYEIGGNIANRLYIKNQDDWELVKDDIKPKFKVGDKIVDKSGLCTYIVKSVSDEYYGLELPHGIIVIPVKHQDDWELVPNHKFNVGDRITFKYYNRKVAKIIEISNDGYKLDNGKTIQFQDENAYEISNDKFDISDLKPLESKVLMRSSNAREWVGTIYSHYSNNKFYGCGMCCDQCIPYEGNEYLLGKTNDCDNYYKIWE